MKKINVFIYSMGSGGAERVVANLIPELMQKYEVHLVLMNSKISYELPKNLQIHMLEDSKPFENGLIKLLKLPFLGLKYKKLCKNLGIDIHFVWMNRPCYVAGFARIFGDKKPLIFNECSTPSVLYKDKNFKSWVSKKLLKWLYPKSDFIFPNSMGNLADLRDNFGIEKSKMAVLYNALNLDEITQKASEKIDFNKPFFLSVGRLDSGKNHELLIRAYAGLKNCDKDLIIIGEGLLKEHLQSVINSLGLADRVHLLGFNANPYKFMSKCHVFVFVSLFEGFSNALIEALACGACVISSDHKSGVRELLGDNEWGYLVGVNDMEQTRIAMQKSLDEEEFIKYYQKKARIRALNFDKNQISKKLIKKLEEIYARFSKNY